MSLVYVTGVPGVGKTTVCEGLEARGYISYDTDRDRLTTLIDNATGQIETNIGNTAEWHDQHSWELDTDKIGAIKEATESEIAFVCGTVTDDVKLWDHFDKHIALVADEQTIVQNLISRSNHSFGKIKEERDRVIERMAAKNAMYQKMGACMIDATQPPDRVVDQVIVFSRK